MTRLLISVLLVLYSVHGLFAQRVCGTTEYHEQMLLDNPDYGKRLHEIEEFTNQFVRDYDGGERALVTIPVVVHVVWNTSAENISDAQIQSQIDVLNRDFRKLNSDVSNTPSVFQPFTADANIEFCLAGVDPNGNSTTGITRTQTSVTAFSTNNAVKYSLNGGKDAWPASSYLNLWVCDISGGILGYAQFPGGSAATDGVVVDYLYFGTMGTATAPFNKGRTATHEIGHWLNLRHIWGDSNCGNDLVSDTPTQQSASYGCPAFPKVSCNNGPNGAMFMNYMDYTDDACMFMFSNGQAARMQALFASGGARSAVLNSAGCGTPAPVCSVPSGRTTSGITADGAALNWSAVNGAVAYNLRYRPTSSATWVAANGLTSLAYTLGGLSACTNYEWQIQTVCGGGLSSAFSSSTTFSTSGCVATYCVSVGQSTADEWIEKIAINTISNTSGNNGGYADYTGLSTTLTAGSAYTLTCTPGYTGAAYGEYWRIWIDYNNDLDFLDAGELVLGSSSASSTAVTGSFTVPSGTSTGLRRMRVSMKYGAVASSCEVFQYGEVEDYSVNIVAGSGGGTCNSNYEDNDFITQATSISTNVNYNSYLCPSGDEDWFRFSNSSSQRNIQVTLQSLPADYDMFLYNPSGVLVAASGNGGTSNEIMKYNNGPVGTYYIRIVGYNGATHGSDSYVLKAARKSTAYRESEDVMEEDGESAIVSAYPNPTDGAIDIRYVAAAEMEINYIVYDLMGRVLIENRFTAVEGENLLSIDLSQFASGNYILSMTDGITPNTVRISRQ